MNELKKRRIKVVLKYTWPFYIVTALIVGFLLSFIFGITHKIPEYKTLTFFISGEVTDVNKLRDDTLEKFKDKELKSFSCISARPDEGIVYTRKLTIAGYQSADVLVIPSSILKTFRPEPFALEIDDNLYNSYYQGFTKYIDEGATYGIEIDPEKVKQYFTLPDETCYMFLNGASKNIGEYSIEQIKEHDNALRVLQDWGK